MRMILTICVGMTFLFGSAVYAQDYDRSGAYVGVGWSFAWDDFEDELESGGVRADVDGSFGINGRVGYRFHPKVAAELEYEWYDDFDFDAKFGGLGRIIEGR